MPPFGEFFLHVKGFAAAAFSDEEEIVISSNRGIPVAALEKSITLESYMDIAKRVLGDEIPFRNIEKKESVIKKLAHSLGF